VAKKAGVQAIVSKWELNYQGPDVEVVDVTEDLAVLFPISDQARKQGRDWREILKHAPVPMEEATD
jgi:ketosteroid isomerase-like protein